MTISLFLYVLIVLALLIAELREDRRAQYFFKPLAAFGFVILALQFGALESTYGTYILTGLIACAVGDVFLLARKSQALFIAGMVAFAMGHVIYLGAFAANPEPLVINVVDPGFSLPRTILLVPIVIAFILGLVVYRDKFLELSKTMKFAIAIYAIIIFSMMFFACNIERMRMRIFVPIAATIFAISDMFVAKDRFVKPNPKNALVITPLYFGAQALFALSVSI